MIEGYKIDIVLLTKTTINDNAHLDLNKIMKLIIKFLVHSLGLIAIYGYLVLYGYYFVFRKYAIFNISLEYTDYMNLLPLANTIKKSPFFFSLSSPLGLLPIAFCIFKLGGKTNRYISCFYLLLAIIWMIAIINWWISYTS